MTASAKVSVVKIRDERWKEKAAFFDRAAERIDVTTVPIDLMSHQRDKKR